MGLIRRTAGPCSLLYSQLRDELDDPPHDSEPSMQPSIDNLIGQDRLLIKHLLGMKKAALLALHPYYSYITLCGRWTIGVTRMKKSSAVNE